jgi:hypothetical protein
MGDACIDSGKFLISMAGISCILTGTVYMEHHMENAGTQHIIGTTVLVFGWILFMYSLSLRRDGVSGVLKFDPESNKHALASSALILGSMVLISRSSSSNSNSKLLVVGGGSLFIGGWLYFLYAISVSHNTERITFVDSDSSKLRKMISVIGVALIIISTGKINVEREKGLTHIFNGKCGENRLFSMGLPLLTMGWVFIALSTSMRI